MEEHREPECGRWPVCVIDRPKDRSKEFEVKLLKKALAAGLYGPSVINRRHRTASASDRFPACLPTRHTISIATGARSRPAIRMISGTFPFKVFLGR
jgi:hypothetical protein